MSLTESPLILVNINKETACCVKSNGLLSMYCNVRKNLTFLNTKVNLIALYLYHNDR